MSTIFAPGSDVRDEIIDGPEAAVRMEFEMFSRFAISWNRRMLGGPDRNADTRTNIRLHPLQPCPPCTAVQYYNV